MTKAAFTEINQVQIIKNIYDYMIRNFKPEKSIIESYALDSFINGSNMSNGGFANAFNYFC